MNSIRSVNSFSRLFARRDLLRRPSLSVLAWSLLSTLLLCVLLFDLLLLTDLLSTRGSLHAADPAEAIQLEILVRGEPPQANLPDGAPHPYAILARHDFNDSGILPAVWSLRHQWWGPLLAALYRSVPWLRQNDTALVLLVLAGVAITVARSLMISRVEGLSQRVASEQVIRMRKSLHRHALRLGPSDVLDTQGETAWKLFTEDVQTVQDGMAAWIAQLPRSLLQLLLLPLFSLQIHWLLTLQCLVPLAACWYLVVKRQERTAQDRRLAEDRVSSQLRLVAESLRRTRLVRGYGMDQFENEQFQTHLERYQRDVSRLKRGEGWAHWASYVSVAVFVGLIIFLVGVKVLAPTDLTLAGGVTLLNSFVFMWRPLDRIRSLGAIRNETTTAADRIYRYLSQIPQVSQAVGAKFLQPLSRTLQFEAVTYRLPGERRNLLDGLDLTLKAGTVTSLVGFDPIETRCIGYLLLRFIEPHSGRVLFDGEDLAWGTLESLRAEAVYVGGRDPFFTATVFDNIRCGRQEFTLQDVTEAAKLTHAHKFIMALPHGYETVLGEHGETLDAGQLFRLGLARAVLRDPALLIIEEPTQPLDEATKTLLEDAYGRIVKKRTVIFLPSRLSTLRRSDQIVLLRDGKLIASDTHAELLRTSVVYRHWEYLRFNEFRHSQGVIS